MNDDPDLSTETIRRALIEAAEAAYEDAGIRGLCAEGRWEAAVQAMRTLDVQAVARGAAGPSALNELLPASDPSAPGVSAASG